MIFIDSNVPMYLVGATHPNKDRALAILTQLVRDGEQFVTDAEVYQEILHRYTAIRRLDAIDPAFRSLDALVEEILTFGRSEVRAARALIGSVDGLSARDALHVVIMREAGTNRILKLRSRLRHLPGSRTLRMI